MNKTNHMALHVRLQQRAVPTVCRLALSSFIGVSGVAEAVTILSGPSFTAATNAPLAGVLTLTTVELSRVSVSVSDGTASWQRNFYDYSTNHAVPLLGFKVGRTNEITVTVWDKYRNAVTAAQGLVFITNPLPGDFPASVLLTNQPAKMEPGYTLFRVEMDQASAAYTTIVDSSGEVVWYGAGPAFPYLGVPALVDVRQLGNGDLFMFSPTNFLEINLLGDAVKSWLAPTNLPIDVHDGVPTDDGTILYLNDASETVTNFPSSTTDPNAPLETANVIYQRVVEISATNSTLLNIWSPIEVLDPRRITYLTALGPTGWDAEHANAVIEDPRDNSLIVSLRHQNAVIKFSRATGQLKWILGPPENWGLAWQPYLLTPVGTPFEWQYGQHSPLITAQGTLLLYDDGNFRACPFDPPVPDASNYSRAVEYNIDENRMQVSQVWDYGSSIPELLYTDKVGSAEQLAQTGNILVDFGSVAYVNGAPPSPLGPGATMARIKEVTHDATPEVVFDLALFSYDNPNALYGDCFVYRSHRIPDLYPHLAVAVADLTVSYNNGVPHLEFSADETRTYVVEASADLVNWGEIGVATQNEEMGLFDFDDVAASQTAARYYRVMTP